jgi:hypothetical protein
LRRLRFATEGIPPVSDGGTRIKSHRSVTSHIAGGCTTFDPV